MGGSSRAGTERASVALQVPSPSSNTNVGVPRLASSRFWLDGGFDRAAVEACPYHPAHRWWTFRLDEVLEEGLYYPGSDEEFTICRACYVPQCGDLSDAEDRCIHPRHHRGFHRSKRGIKEPVGG